MENICAILSETSPLQSWSPTGIVQLISAAAIFPRLGTRMRTIFFEALQFAPRICTLQSFRQVTGSHILRVQIYLRAYYTRAHSRRRQRDSHYIFTHLLCSIPMPYTSVGLEYRFSIHFGRTKQKNGDELRTLRSLRTSQTDPSKIDRAYGTCVNFFSLYSSGSHEIFSTKSS